MEVLVIIGMVVVGVFFINDRAHARQQELFRETMEVLNRRDAELKLAVHNEVGAFGCRVLGRQCAECPHRQPPALPEPSDPPPPPEPAPLPAARLLKRGR